MRSFTTNLLRMTAILALVPMLAAPAQAQRANDTQPKTASIEQVEAKYVCMITNKLYEDVQIRVPIGEKIYYGCCRGCVTELKMKPESRMATDPVTGDEVDKATAVIGALPDGSVRYFESEKTLRQFAASAESKDSDVSNGS